MDTQFKELITIGIDIDAVVANTNHAILCRMNRRFGLRLQLSDMITADFVEKFSGLPLIERQEFADSLFTDTAFYGSLEPIEGAPTYIQRLSDDGFHIVYVTSRPLSTNHATHEWLTTHKLLPRNSLVIHPKEGDNSLQYKVKTSRWLGLKLFIEDRLEIANRMSIPVLLFDYPYNQKSSKSNVIRIRSWSSAYQCITSSIWKNSMRIRQSYSWK